MSARNAYPSGHLVPSPILGLADAPIVETKFLELAMSLLDFSPRIPLGTSSILLRSYMYFELLSKFGAISFQIYVSKGISHPVFYSDLVYKLRRIKGETNFISLGSKIVKRLRRLQYDPVIIEKTLGLVLGPLQPCTDHSLSFALWLIRRLGLYDGPCINLLRGARVLIPVPSDCQSLGLNSHTDCA